MPEPKPYRIVVTDANGTTAAALLDCPDIYDVARAAYPFFGGVIKPVRIEVELFPAERGKKSKR
ncbi:MAG: hypothetical protein P9L99_19795 [Candidatus Lernaella stagnicola]|nr:hypothetical protein [Candidatus Lernaella stagnicola]